MNATTISRPHHRWITVLAIVCLSRGATTIGCSKPRFALSRASSTRWGLGTLGARVCPVVVEQVRVIPRHRPRPAPLRDVVASPADGTRA